MSGPPVVIRAQDVSKRFSRSLKSALWFGLWDIADQLTGRGRPDQLRESEFWALYRINFQVKQGESLGLIGNNGAGKSTLLKILIGRLNPTQGEIMLAGRTTAIADVSVGFNPLLSGRENVYINAALLGLSRDQTEALFERIVGFSELGDVIDAPLQTYSTGMKARLGFSVAAHTSPDLLFLDEVLEVGDINFKRKCRRFLRRFVDEGGTLLVVSHDMHGIQNLCQRTIVLHEGEIIHDGATSEAVDLYFRLQRGQTLPGEELPARADEGAPASQPGGPQPESKPAPPNLRPDLVHPTEIEAVEINPESGLRLLQGEPAWVTIRYHSRERIPRVVWGFSICTPDMAVQIGSGLAGLDDRVYPLEPGRGEFRCRIPRLPLCAGRYVIRAGIGEFDTGASVATWGWDDAPSTFEVWDHPSREANYRQLMGDLTTIPVEIP